MDARLVDEAVEAIRAGRAVVLPTDTVYGLCTTPHLAQPVEQLYRLKGRNEHQPVALLAPDLDTLLECVPELRGRPGSIAEALLPGPLTLVFPNPAWRFQWLTGARPDTIGVRVPELEGDTRAILKRIGVVAATSANLTGGSDPKSLAEVPDEIRAGAAVVIDGGELPGKPSTVVDLTGAEPQIIREGALPAAEVLERLDQLV
jgi:tRNA threonylcarbamoyl adenosine modification protein (Sua5/YciO/YrdC/YwlC family)